MGEITARELAIGTTAAPAATGEEIYGLPKASRSYVQVRSTKYCINSPGKPLIPQSSANLLDSEANSSLRILSQVQSHH
jgi:hypothetical protein